MRGSEAIPAFGLMVAVLCLNGCAGVRYPSYYTLNLAASWPSAMQPPSITQQGPVPGSVAVREFDAPTFLREGPIVYRETAEQLEFYHYHRWAVDPRRTVTNAIVRQLQSSGLFRSADLFDGHESPECLLTGTIDHLEEVDHGADVSVETGLSARLIDYKTGEVLWQGTSSKQEKLAQRSVSGVVAGISQAMETTVETLIASMQQRVPESWSSAHADTKKGEPDHARSNTTR